MKNKNNSIIIIGMIFFLIIFMTVMGLIIFNKNISKNDNMINIDGISTIRVMPDLVGIYFNIQTNGSNAIESNNKNSKIEKNMTAELMNIGVKKEDIITENFNSYPDYNYENNKRVKNGYKTVHSFSIKINAKEKDLIGEVLDIILKSGANVNYLNYELTQKSQNKYKIEAIKNASEDAKNKANAIADGFDKKVNRLVSVKMDDFSYYPWRMYDGLKTEENSFSDTRMLTIEPKKQDITVKIHVIFSLK